jgi:hypothetical protein
MKRPPPKGLRAIIPNKNEYVQHSTYGEHRFSPHPRTQEQSSTLSENSEENLVFFTMLPSILKVTHNKISDTAELNFEDFSAASGVECSSHERFYCNSWAAVCET